MTPFDAPDIHHLRAAHGWHELGNDAEALAELEQITPAARSHPDVLEIRWHIYAKAKKWDDCRDIAAALLKEAPERAEAWLHLSYSVRRATGGGIQAAYDVIYQAAKRFPKEPTIPYNLACYACQLGKPAIAKSFLKQAFRMAKDPKPIKAMALADPDLEPLWPEIAEI